VITHAVQVHDSRSSSGGFSTRSRTHVREELLRDADHIDAAPEVYAVRTTGVNCRFGCDGSVRGCGPISGWKTGQQW